jgi:hypothetical protein
MEKSEQRFVVKFLFSKALAVRGFTLLPKWSDPKIKWHDRGPKSYVSDFLITLDPRPFVLLVNIEALHHRPSPQDTAKPECSEGEE